MPDEQETTETEPTPEDPTPKPTDAPTQEAAPVAEEPKGQDGKVIPVKHGDFKKIKDEAKAKGRQEALAELDVAAAKVGFKSMAEALETLAKIQQKAAEQTQTTSPAPQEKKQMAKTPDPKTTEARASAEAARVADERQKMRKQWRTEEKRRRDLQRQLDAKDAEMALREEMYRLGVQDVDYGLRLLTRELAGKSEEEIGAFDRKAFFDGVRKDRPYLFGEKVSPATTGTNGAQTDGSNPAAPPAGDPAKKAAETQQFDGRTATPQQVSDRLKALGLNPHM